MPLYILSFPVFLLQSYGFLTALRRKPWDIRIECRTATDEICAKDFDQLARVVYAGLGTAFEKPGTLSPLSFGARP